MKRRCAIVIYSVATLFSAGCTLDPPVKYGQECGKEQGGPAGVFTGEIYCTKDEILNGNKEECIAFAEYFDGVHCPKDSSYCNEQTQWCSPVKQCVDGEHLSNGTCVEDKVTSCGSNGTDCTKQEGWLSGGCENGQCIPIKCTDGYIIYSNICLENPCKGSTHYVNGACDADSIEHCGEHDRDCSRIINGWIDGKCENKECFVNQCDEGFELKDNQCTPTIDCTSGMHIYSGNCEQDSVESCGSHNNNCTEIVGWNTGRCDNATCIIESCKKDFLLTDNMCVINCGDNTHIYNESCEDNDVKNCGAHDQACADTTKGWVSGNCISGKCVPTTCSEDYVLIGSVCEPRVVCEGDTHVYNNGCEDNSISNCGTHGTTCSRKNASAQCVNGGCNYTCNSNTHVYNNTCEANDVNNCGSHGNSCSVENGTGTCNSGSCSISCNSDYHKYGLQCEKNSVDNCGAHNVKCYRANASAVCSSGECSYLCNTGFGESNGTCIVNTSDIECGHATCSLENAVPTCDNTVCLYRCIDGYVYLEGKCVPDSSCDDGYKTITFNGNKIKAACINDKDQLDAFLAAVEAGSEWPDSQNVDNAYILTNDIDVGTVSWCGPSYSFKGKLFGGGYTIKGTNINVGYNCGMILNASGAIIDGLNFEVDTPNGAHGVGTIVESATNNTIIQYCHTSGTINGDINVGGIAADLVNSTIKNSSSSVIIDGDDNADKCGGLVGEATSSIIENSSFNGLISCYKSVGGLAGLFNSGSIVNSHVDATLKGAESLGGLVGLVNYGNLKVTSSYSNSSIILASSGSTDQYAGGIVGYITYGSGEPSVNIVKSGTFNYFYSDQKSAYMGGLIGYSGLAQSTSTIENAFSYSVFDSINNSFIVSNNQYKSLIINNVYAFGYVLKSDAVCYVDYDNGVQNNFFAWDGLKSKCKTFGTAPTWFSLQSSNTFVLNGSLDKDLNKVENDVWALYECNMKNEKLIIDGVKYYNMPLPQNMVTPFFCKSH